MSMLLLLLLLLLLCCCSAAAGDDDDQTTIEEHSIEVYNSHRPLDRLTLTLTLTFDLIFIGGRGIVMDYPCAKIGDFSFSRFGFIVRTDRQTESQRRMIAILTRLPST